MMTEQEQAAMEARAHELWREREMEFPPRVRRLKPDDLDMVSGTWAWCLAKAWNEFRDKRTLDR